jgi:hypothetical protein
MFFFCCSPRRPTRFQSVAELNLKTLQAEHDTFRNKGRIYAAVALAKKREAAEYYRQGNTFEALATAMEAKTHEEMAMRFLHIVEKAQYTIREVNRQSADYDMLDSAATTAEVLSKLGSVQREGLDGTEEVPSIDVRIEATNRIVDDFKRLVAQTDVEMKKVVLGTGNENGVEEDDLLTEIQRWGLGQLQSPQPTARDLTPDQLEMTREDD